MGGPDRRAVPVAGARPVEVAEAVGGPGARETGPARRVPGPLSYRQIVVRAAPFALYMAFLVAAPALDALSGAARLDPRWWYGVQIALPMAAIGYWWPLLTELGPGTGPSGRDAALAAVVGSLVFAAWIHLDRPLLALGTSDGFDPTGPEGRPLLGLAAVRLAGAVLVVPVMEELFWRSFVMRWLERPAFLSVRPESIGWMPLLVSSALFATEHHLWFAGLLAGLAYAWIYRRSGTLWTPVIAHAVTNALLGWWVLTTGAWTFW